MTLRFGDEARRELVQAATYYDAERAGLGDEFVAEVEAATRLILEAPRRWPVLRRRARRYRLHRFPYGVVYTVRRREIEVVAVMHLSRNPTYWDGRLNDQ